MNTSNELFRESQPLIPLALLIPMIATFPIVVLLILFVIPMGLDETARMAFIIAAVIIPILEFAVFHFLVRLNVTVTYDSVKLVRGESIPIEDIESVSQDESKTFKEFCAREGLGLPSVIPIAFTNVKGLRFGFKNGEYRFIGSKMPYEFESAVKLAMRQAERKEEQ